MIERDLISGFLDDLAALTAAHGIVLDTYRGQLCAYAAAKGGVVALTHALAVSLGPDIRVNAVAPGWIETRPYARRDKRQPVEHDEAERLQHPAGRVGVPRDIAEALEWLVGAGFVTGQTIVVDGGMQKRMIYKPDLCQTRAAALSFRKLLVRTPFPVSSRRNRQVGTAVSGPVVRCLFLWSLLLRAMPIHGAS